MAVRNSPERWHSPAFSGDVEFVALPNSSHYKIGSGDSQFTLAIDWLCTRVRAYRDPGDIAHVAVINNAQGRNDGFWALTYIDRLYTRNGPMNRENLVDFRYAIQPNRTPDFRGFVFPHTNG